MAKRFFYMCGGILLLVVAYEFGANRAQAQVGQFRMLGIAFAVVGDKVYHLDDINPPIGWRELPYASWDLPPVPASSLVTYTSGMAVTDNGEGWYRPNGVWTSLGILPGVTSIENTTWGEVKARYRR